MNVGEAPCILVVEDDCQIRSLLRLILEDEGYRVYTVDSTVAYAVAKAELPALIFLDLMMPYVSGQEVGMEIRACPETANMPIVLLTGLLHEAESAAEMLNACAIVYKPFDVETLLDLAAEIVGAGVSSSVVA